jgi:hypothetical protein
MFEGQRGIRNCSLPRVRFDLGLEVEVRLSSAEWKA